MKKNYKNYANTRFKFDRHRKEVWQEIARHLGRWTNGNFVVELGSGYCDFINSVKARRKIAVDKFINPGKFCDESVEPIFGDFKKIKRLESNSVDVFLASNFFEHLELKEVKQCLNLIKEKLRAGGRLVIIQPNYKYSYKNYFDDYTHLTVWSDESLKDFINASGLRVIKMKSKFLPLTMRSRLPKSRLLVRLYLNLPIKPFAGQMLIIARKV